ncbi:MAG: hypothetical protein JSR77_05665 [Planctomycetes bacterium]|nr:hypothetical protein [Planctomycetota bacterium]
MRTLEPECPRCGYDLGGEVARWGDSCPTTGTCSECGHGLEWADVFAPDRKICPGLVEHAVGVRQSIAWGLRTGIWMVVPWLFWRRVKLHHEVRPRKIVIALLACLAVVFAVDVCIECVVLAMTGIAAPTAAVSSRYTTSVAPGSRPQLMILNVVLFPFGRYVWEMNWTNLTSVVFKLSFFKSSQLTAPPVCSFMLMTGAWPLLLLALPVSRRMAKVRYVHIARAALYSLVTVVLLCMTFMIVKAVILGMEAVSGVLQVAGVRGYSLLRAPVIGWVAIGLLIWHAAWWHSAITTHWKLHRGNLVWFLLQVAVVLLAGVILLLASPLF